MKLSLILAAATALCMTGSGAYAGVQEIDISPYVNFGGPSGDTNYGQYAGNAGAGVTFNLLAPNSSGNNTWLGADSGDQLVIPVGLTNVSTVYTLLNTRFGQAGVTNTQVTFNYDDADKDSETFNLKGGNDIRDYNDFIYTNTLLNTIGNPNAQNFWSSNGDDTGTRQDLQTFELPTNLLNDELATIVITDPVGGGNGNYQPLLTAVDYSLGTVSAAPEPSTWLLMFAGIGGIGLILRRAKKTMGFRFEDALSA